MWGQEFCAVLYCGGRNQSEEKAGQKRRNAKSLEKKGRTRQKRETIKIENKKEISGKCLFLRGICNDTWYSAGHSVELRLIS
jgi:hypothetical protein